MTRGLHSRRALAGTLLSALCCASCGDTSPVAGSAPTDPGPPTYGNEGPPNFLQLVPEAPFNTAYRGQRLVELYYEPQFPVLYREDVGSDGLGKFSVEVVEVLVSASVDQDLFLLLQNQRQVQVYKHRDFRIQDYALFLANYTYNVSDAATVVADVGCLQVEIQANDSPATRYLADIDAATGLVMRWQEFELGTNQLLARVAFEGFELDGDVSDLALIESNFSAVSYAHDAPEFEEALGFAPLIPNFQPGSGFHLCHQAEVLSAQGENWAKLYMTDGVEMVVLMHSARVMTGSNGMGKKGEVAAVRVGSWGALRGEVNGYPVIMAGRTSESNLASVLDSALP